MIGGQGTGRGPFRIGNTDGTAEVDIDNANLALVMMDEIHYNIHQGIFYTASTAPAISASSDFDILLVTGPNSAHLRVHGAATHDMLAYLFESPTFTNNGTALPTHNHLRSSSNTATLTAFAAPTITGDGTQLAEILIPSGSRQSIAGANDTSAEWVLAPNLTYLVRVSNTIVSPATAGYIGVALDFYEPSLSTNASSETLPVDGATGWWSSFSSSDYELSGGRVTTLYDRSGFGNHFTVHSGKSGPTLTTIDGDNWMTLDGSTTLMSAVNTAIDPDSGDFTFIAVFRSSATGTQGIFGKNGPGNPNYGLFVGVNNDRSLYFQCRDTVLANTLILEHDDPGTDYTDGTKRLACVTYDDSEADAYLYGSDFADGNSVDSDLGYSSVNITPTNRVFLGDWTDGSFDFNGEIAELICFAKVLTNTERQAIEAYLKAKWSIS